MSHPYRASDPALPPPPAARLRDPEAVAVYLLLGALGVIRLIVAAALGESAGAESTIALAMVLAAAWGLLARTR